MLTGSFQDMPSECKPVPYRRKQIVENFLFERKCVFATFSFEKKCAKEN